MAGDEEQLFTSWQKPADCLCVLQSCRCYTEGMEERALGSSLNVRRFRLATPPRK
jgi:hypothetical protein